MKSKLLAASLALAACAAFAEPPSDAAIEELLVATKAEAMTNSMHANMDAIMQQSMNGMLQGQTLNDQQRQLSRTMPSKMAAVMREELSWASLKPLYIQLYQESFTQDEINGLLAFYKSPAGVAYVNKMPVVMQKSVSLMQQRMAPMLQRMQAAMKQSMDEAAVAPGK